MQFAVVSRVVRMGAKVQKLWVSEIYCQANTQTRFSVSGKMKGMQEICTLKSPNALDSICSDWYCSGQLYNTTYFDIALLNRVQKTDISEWNNSQK